MDDLRLQEVEAHRARLGALASNAVSNCLLRILGHQGLELALSPFMVEEGLAGVPEQTGKFAPGVRGAHVDNADSLNARSGRLGVDQVRGLAGLDAAPELLFRG